MSNRSTVPHTLLTFFAGLLLTGPAHAASLQRVDSWGASGVPSTVSMYIYVPDALAENPPILVLAHYCGGTADAVFGQARGGGIVDAADQHGFIMVVPQATNPDGSGRCWDVGSDQALTRDGGGDTEAILQMVQYTVAQYGANADRVYATGDSSGGMMTQALLALYPDVFKAGAAMAGVPAGCWAVGNPDGSWSGACAGGTVTHTPEEWGAIVDDMYPGYTGHRARVQLFHGDADSTIQYPNHTEAIKQWTNVLGLSQTPTSTDTVQLGTHQATRERWENSCGYVVLDAFTSHGGDHGPSDALFLSDYVIPFLGLDQSGALDPEIEQCSGGAGGAATGGSPGSGGQPTGGSAGSGGGGVPTGGGGSAAGGSGPVGGTEPTGGLPGSGGVATGGLGPSSGGSPSGGAGGTGGGPTTGGLATSGGSSAVTGGVGASGAVATGGIVSGTTGGTGTGGDTPTAGKADAGDADGCSCSAVGERHTPGPLGILALVGLLGIRPLARRKQRGASSSQR